MRYFFLLLLHYSGFNQDDEAAVRRASRFTEKLAIFATLYLNHMFCDLTLETENLSCKRCCHWWKLSQKTTFSGLQFIKQSFFGSSQKNELGTSSNFQLIHERAKNSNAGSANSHAYVMLTLAIYR